MKRIFLGMLLIANTALAGINVYEFSEPDKQARFKHLSEELRCLVCQNQNLADSSAELAQDLRRQVYEMIQQGRSDQEIISYMTERYGDFVLYRPPVKSTTLPLWIGPFILFVLAAGILIVVIRRRTSTRNEGGLSQEENRRLKSLLDGGEKQE